MKSKFILLIAVLLIVSCKKDDQTTNNNFINTKWTATDDIAEFIYGKTCTTSVEFLTETTCQEIDVRTGMNFGAGTFVKQGTYTYSADSVKWQIETSTSYISGKISGSVMTTNMGTIVGGKRVYTKN